MAEASTPEPSPLYAELEAKQLKDISRRDVIQALVRKHESLVQAMTKERDEKAARLKQLEQALSAARKARDKDNSGVSKLKVRRNTVQKETRSLRNQFFSLLEKAAELDKSTQELSKYRKLIEDMDWKIQTEAVTVQQEKGFLDEIRSAMVKVSQANLASQKKLGIDSKVTELGLAIGSKSAEAQNYHDEMLALAGKADEQHASVVGMEKEAGPLRGRVTWLKHRVENHRESAKYWRDRARMLEKEAAKAPTDKKLAPPKADKPKEKKPAAKAQPKGKPKDAPKGKPKDKPKDAPKETPEGEPQAQPKDKSGDGQKPEPEQNPKAQPDGQPADKPTDKLPPAPVEPEGKNGGGSA